MPKKGTDIAEFQRLEKYEDGEPDYMVCPSFPREPEHDLRHLIDYRIKLLLKEDLLLEPSDSQLVATSCKISCKSPNLSMHLKLLFCMSVLRSTGLGKIGEYIINT